MSAAITTSVSIQKTLFDQAEALAQQLNISQNQLFELAIEHFIRNYTHQPDLNEEAESAFSAAKSAQSQLVVNQGDVYWLQLDAPGGLEPGIPHPHVVLQDNVLNHSRLDTVVVCALTSNLKRSNLPGNVLLEAGEGNLPKQSVVETSKVSTVHKAQLGAYIGSLSEQRIHQIAAAMRFLQRSFFAR